MLLRLICILLLYSQFVNAQTPDNMENLHSENIFINRDIATLSNPNDAKFRLQLDYAQKVAQQMILYLNAYVSEYNESMDQETFSLFAEQLLASDPFIQCFDYQTQHILSLTFADDLSISPQLNGLTLVYSLRQGVWRFDYYEFVPRTKQGDSNLTSGDAIAELPYNDDTEELNLPEQAMSSDTSTSAAPAMIGFTAPYHLDVLYAYGIITHHCLEPMDYRAEEGKWSDKDWCPVWLEHIMSP